MPQRRLVTTGWLAVVQCYVASGARSSVPSTPAQQFAAVLKSVHAIREERAAEMAKLANPWRSSEEGHVGGGLCGHANPTKDVSLVEWNWRRWPPQGWWRQSWSSDSWWQSKTDKTSYPWRAEKSASSSEEPPKAPPFNAFVSAEVQPADDSEDRRGSETKAVEREIPAIELESSAPASVLDAQQMNNILEVHLHFDEHGNPREIGRAPKVAQVRHRSSAAAERRADKRNPESAEASVISELRVCEEKWEDLTGQLNITPNDPKLQTERRTVEEHIASLEARLEAHRQRRSKMNTDKTIWAAMRASSVGEQIIEEDEEEDE